MSVERERPPIDVLELISKYEIPIECKFCKSNDLEHPLTGYVICNGCRKHTVFGQRFQYIEETDVLITKDNIKYSWLNAAELYDPEDRIEGTSYYLLGKLIEKL